MGYWYFSFVDDRRPAGDQFVGACLVSLGPDELLSIPERARRQQSAQMAMALTKTHLLHINPGGAVKAAGPLDLDPAKASPWLNRLLSPVDAQDLPDLT